MSEYLSTPCYYCKHYDRENNERHTCVAYPDGIPMEFITVRAKHLAVRGDEVVPVAFEKRDDLTNAQERQLARGLAVPES